MGMKPKKRFGFGKSLSNLHTFRSGTKSFLYIRKTPAIVEAKRLEKPVSQVPRNAMDIYLIVDAGTMLANLRKTKRI